MTIGASLFLIAVGAILKFAVTYTVVGIDIQVVGVVLMVAGGIGLLLGLFFMAQANKQAPPAPGYQDPNQPPPPPQNPPQY
ncbi:MAG: DUF6458 family protein [Solirubrobacterales bacterium]